MNFVCFWTWTSRSIELVCEKQPTCDPAAFPFRSSAIVLPLFVFHFVCTLVCLSFFCVCFRWQQMVIFETRRGALAGACHTMLYFVPVLMTFAKSSACTTPKSEIRVLLCFLMIRIFNAEQTCFFKHVHQTKTHGTSRVCNICGVSCLGLSCTRGAWIMGDQVKNKTPESCAVGSGW